MDHAPNSSTTYNSYSRDLASPSPPAPSAVCSTTRPCAYDRYPGPDRYQGPWTGYVRGCWQSCGRCSATLDPVEKDRQKHSAATLWGITNLSCPTVSPDSFVHPDSCDCSCFNQSRSSLGVMFTMSLNSLRRELEGIEEMIWKTILNNCFLVFNHFDLKMLTIQNEQFADPDLNFDGNRSMFYSYTCWDDDVMVLFPLNYGGMTKPPPDWVCGLNAIKLFTGSSWLALWFKARDHRGSGSSGLGWELPWSTGNVVMLWSLGCGLDSGQSNILSQNWSKIFWDTHCDMSLKTVMHIEKRWFLFHFVRTILLELAGIGEYILYPATKNAQFTIDHNAIWQWDHSRARNDSGCFK